MMSSSGSADFLVSYTAEDRDWAEWIASHLGALGYAYVLQEPPSGPGLDPFHAADAAAAAGQDVIVILSYAFIDSLHASGAADRGHLQGPGRAISVSNAASLPCCAFSSRASGRQDRGSSPAASCASGERCR